MKLHVPGALTVAAFSLIMFANVAVAQPCANSGTQPEMEACWNNIRQKDKKTIAQLVEKLRQRYADEAQSKKLFDKSQATWSAYRDAECAFRTLESQQGSAGAVYLAICLHDLDALRIKDLQSVVDAP